MDGMFNKDTINYLKRSQIYLIDVKIDFIRKYMM